MNTYVKIHLSLLFAFILITGSIPFTSIARAYEQSYDNYNSDDYLSDFIKKYELPIDFNRPTPNDPYPNEIIPADFPLRDACLKGKEIPYKFLSTFDVHAIEVDIVYNAFGFHDPDGRMYVLEQDLDRILQKVAENPGKTVTEVQPLVIRTNVGQCVEIKFTNDLRKEYASIHPTGIALDPNKSDGSFVGFNEDTTVAPGESITYRWFPDVEGANFFSDAARQVVESDLSLLGDWTTEQIHSLRQHGLFGALIVEAQHATWTDPFTGEPLRSGVKADIHYPDKIRKDTREFVSFYHDEAGIVDPFGDPTLEPNGEIGPFYTMNYRGDSIDSRSNPKFLPDNCQPGVDPEVCQNNDFFYNSWVHGDPGGGDLVFPAYSGDPVRHIIIGGQTEESHVHHLHEHRWKADSSFSGSPTIDVQTVAAGNEFLQPVNLAFGDLTVNPDTTYAQALVAGGAGYQTGDADDEHFTGDVIFHCHLFPHYGMGMWSIMRVLDKITSPLAQINVGAAEDGSGGNSLTPVGPVLIPLADSNDNTQLASDFQPGFPYFIESNPDGSPKRPPDPNGGIGGRDYTDLEWRSTNYFQRAVQMGEDPNDRSVAKPGAPYDDPCPVDAPPRKYNIVAITDDVIYNKFGHHDPDGRVYVLAEEAADILSGIKEPEPLIIRAEMGECLEITFENQLEPPDTLPLFDESKTLSMHTHFVGFDVLGSDGVVVGYDYMQANKAPEGNVPGEKISYRWYADEQGNIFWHDHISGIEKGFHGTGGMLVVEPPNSAWLDPENGVELQYPTSTEIMVAPEVGHEDEFKAYREFVMLLGDFQELFDKDGFPIMMQAPNLNNPNGPEFNIGAPPQSSLADHGVMSINYRNEPLWERMKQALANPNPPEITDPSNIFHSGLHGDPSTHIFKAFGNDPIKMRLLASSHEELHNFVLNGLHPTGFEEFVTPFLGLQSQTIGTAEQFTFNFIAPVAVSARNDYMYSSYGTNDIFNGMWGLTRIWCNQQSLAADPLFGDTSPNPVQLAPLPGTIPINCVDQQGQPIQPIQPINRAGEESNLGTQIANLDQISTAQKDKLEPSFVDVLQNQLTTLVQDATLVQDNDIVTSNGEVNILQESQTCETCFLLNKGERPPPPRFLPLLGYILADELTAYLEDPKNVVPIGNSADVNSIEELCKAIKEVAGTADQVTEMEIRDLFTVALKNTSPSQVEQVIDCLLKQRLIVDTPPTESVDTPPTQTLQTICDDCFNTTDNGGPLSPGLLKQLDAYLAVNEVTVGAFTGTVRNVQGLCDVIEEQNKLGTQATEKQIRDILNAAFPGNSNPNEIDEIINCLLDLGLITSTTIPSPTLCDDCFNTTDNGGPLSPGLLKQLDAYLAVNEVTVGAFTGTVRNVQGLCDVIEEQNKLGTQATEKQIRDILNAAFPGNSNPNEIDEIIDCLLSLELILETPPVPVDPNSPTRIILLPPEKDPQRFGDSITASSTQLASAFSSTPLIAQQVSAQQLAQISPSPPTGVPPIPVSDLGIDPISCNPDADKIEYKVVALKKDITLNKYNDIIPDGIFFVLEEDVNAIKSGQKPIEPLIIRANVGDCVVLELTNNLGPDKILPHDHPLEPGECNEHVKVACLDPNEWPTSNRASLHPDNVFYDVGAFDGTNMGYNPVEQTVGPGETIVYEWQTVKTGVNVLTDFGDLRGHRHHGGYGMLIVEPESAEYLDINTKQPIKSGPFADIVFPNPEWNFREFALTLGTSHYIITQEDPDLCILPITEEDAAANPNLPCNQSPINDQEDQGFPAINYRSEPFVHRLIEASQDGPPADPNDAGVEASKRISQLQSSIIHGDPSTPILRVPEGKPTVLRIADVGDSVRGFSFHLAGHIMLRPAPISLDANDLPVNLPFEPYLETGTTDQTSPARSFSLELVGGAGGLQYIPGDYLYQDQKLARSVEGGAWGILRVQPNIDPLKTVQYLLNDLSYSKELPDFLKELLTEKIQKILENLLSGDQTKIEQICSIIIPDLLKLISEYESGTGGHELDLYSTQQYPISEYENANVYSNPNNGDYSYDKYFDYYDEYDGQYDNGYSQKTLNLEKIKDTLRNIAYAVC